MMLSRLGSLSKQEQDVLGGKFASRLSRTPWVRVWFVLAAALGVLPPTGADGQTLLVVDLARVKSGAQNTESVTPGTYAVRIDSKNPHGSYRVSVLVRQVSTSPIDTAGAPLLKFFQVQPPQCVPATNILKVKATITEAAIAKLVTEAETAMKNPVSPCTVEELSTAIATTRLEWDHNIEVRQGQEMTVRVERDPVGDAEKSTVVWTKTFTTGPAGEWRATYGFASAFTRMSAGKSVFDKRTEYYVNSKDSTITGRLDRGGADLVASAIFHYLPAEKRGQRLVFSPVAGIGFNLESPTVIGGYSVTYGENLNLAIGALGRREGVLLAKYEEGDKVTAVLEPAQLTDQKLRIRPFVMLSLRLASSPFAGTASQGKEVKKEDPK